LRKEKKMELTEVMDKVLEYLRENAVGENNSCTITAMLNHLNKDTPKDQVGVTRERITKALHILTMKERMLGIHRSSAISPITNRWGYIYWVEIPQC
jgi:hypothetical protein